VLGLKRLQFLVLLGPRGFVIDDEGRFADHGRLGVGGEADFLLRLWW